jgi:hypothetical protein
VKARALNFIPQRKAAFLRIYIFFIYSNGFCLQAKEPSFELLNKNSKAKSTKKALQFFVKNFSLLNSNNLGILYKFIVIQYRFYFIFKLIFFLDISFEFDKNCRALIKLSEFDSRNKDFLLKTGKQLFFFIAFAVNLKKFP